MLLETGLERDKKSLRAAMEQIQDTETDSVGQKIIETSLTVEDPSYDPACAF